ncbi:MAG TPA: hypothetical protein VFS83_06905 [Ktedonobacterales bacterium]|nr:hypothetical protein [Ktedonobacterales bacterium]
MEKKNRSSRKDPASSSYSNARNQGRQGNMRQARTLADATDPRTPVRRRNDFEPEYSARDEQDPSMPQRLTLPSVPSMPATSRDSTRHRAAHSQSDRVSYRRGNRQSSWDEYAQDGEEWSNARYPDEDAYDYDTGRSRAQSIARPLTLTHIDELVEVEQDEYRDSARGLVPADSVPDLVAWRPPMPAQRKPVYTRTIETARRHPWSVSRIGLALIAIGVTLLLSITGVGEPSQPLMAFYNAQAAGANAQNIGALVKPLTQGKLVSQYDSVAQYNEYWGAACSAAVLAETLTAWGVKGATIGHMIDELGSNISPYGGLLSYSGFQKVASLHQMRSDYRDNLSYKQMLYITNTLHLPLIVNVRISYGFYHFFSGGHFLVMTAVDSQGIRLVDSSLYYVTYMPLSVFNSMFTGRTVLLLPSAYTYTLPSR